MSEIRMSLKQAGELLGLKPNSVRSRFKKGKLRGEADNMGKLWVWIDPTKLINDQGSKEPSSKASLERLEVNEIKALRDHLKVTTEQLDKANAEIADLKPRAMDAVRLQAEVKGLLDQRGRGDAEISRLVASLEKTDTERRELIEAVLKRRPSLWDRITGRT